MPGIIFNSPTVQNSLQSQVDSLQTTLATLNQQIIILQETLQEREQEIADLKAALSQTPLKTGTNSTIISILINLFRFIFWPRKE